MVIRSDNHVVTPANDTTTTELRLPVLTLFRRAGCHLCEDLENQLAELFEPADFRLERVDIDEDPTLQARYNEWVPVLTHGDFEICHHFLDLVAVQKVLAGYNTHIRRRLDGAF